MKGFADVIVCDGFVGNIVLKFAEGMVDVFTKMLKDVVDSAVRRRLGQVLVRPAFADLKRKMNYEEYGGGILLGLPGIVVVAHGRSSPLALKNAIRLASLCVKNGVITEIKKTFSSISKNQSATKEEN